MNLGAGVAYKVDALELQNLHRLIGAHFHEALIAQDRQSFRPHITIMNKSTPDKAKALLEELSNGFRPYIIKATGLDLWVYLGGTWEHRQTINFII